jgi:hypothetical protein
MFSFLFFYHELFLDKKIIFFEIYILIFFKILIINLIRKKGDDGLYFLFYSCNLKM